MSADFDATGELIVSPELVIPLAEFDFQYARSSGPGGQNVNKLNTKVQLRWDVTNSPTLPGDVRQRFLSRFASRITVDGDIVISRQAHRKQRRNRRACVEAIWQMLLEVAEAPKTRRATKPSRASKERRLHNKRHRAERKNLRRKPNID